MDNSARAAKVKIPQSVKIKCDKYYNQTYLSNSIIVWANRYSIILEVVVVCSSSSSSSKFIKSPASGSSDLIYNNWKSNKNDL